MECIKRAQTIQLKLTGMVGGFEVRNLSEEILSTSLPEGSSSSDAAQNSKITSSFPDCDNSAVKIRRFDMEVLGFSLFPSQKFAGTPD